MSTWFKASGTKETTAGSGSDGEPADRTIYVRAIIDVAGVLKNSPAPANDTENPVAVSFDGGHLVVTTTAGTVDQSTGGVTLNAGVGDTVRFFAKSGSNNFGEAALLQDVRQAADDALFDDAALLKLPQTGIAPALKPGELTAAPVKRTFWFWQYAIAHEGTQTFGLILALYDRDEAGQPRFAGLYRWDIALTVLSSPLPPDANTKNQERTP